MLKKLKAIAVTAATVASIGPGAGAAHADADVPTSGLAANCRIHTYNDGYTGPGHPVEYMEVNGWGGRARP